MNGSTESKMPEVSNIKATLSALFMVFWCIFGALSMTLAKLFRPQLAQSFPLFFHGVVCKLCSLKCETVGTPVAKSPVLYVSNHVSYLDVFVLGSMLRGAFVAKSEVASWPVFGKLAKLQNTLFLERNPRRAAEQIRVVKGHLAAGGNLIVFPEGTSTQGTDVARFRSSLFAAAEGICVQPVTVAYVSFEGEPMTQTTRDRYAWYLPNPSQQPAMPNRPFASHFFCAMGLKRCTVKVIFHDPIILQAGERKECAQYCESSIRRGLHETLGSGLQNDATSKLSHSA